MENLQKTITAKETNSASSTPMAFYGWGKNAIPLDVNKPLDEIMWEEQRRAFNEESLKEIREQQVLDRQLKFRRYSSMGSRFEKCSFDNFTVREGTETAYEAAKKYAETFDKSEESLFLWGLYGSGKSHLAAAVANWLIEQKKLGVIFTSTPDLLERIRSTFRKDNSETEDKLFRAYMDADLLILDDLGAEKSSDWTADVLFRICDGRYQKEKPTFFTSNLKPSELASDRLLGRVYDRILECNTVIQMKASSYRAEKAKSRYEEIKRSKSL